MDYVEMLFVKMSSKAVIPDKVCDMKMMMNSVRNYIYYLLYTNPIMYK